MITIHKNQTGANSVFFNFATWNKTLDDTTKGRKIDVPEM